jgi:hypothetical protein
MNKIRVRDVFLEEDVRFVATRPRNASLTRIFAHFRCRYLFVTAFSTGAIRSIGSGKTIVEFLSAAITVSVSR